jgi:transposase
LQTSQAAFPETVKARAQYGPHLQALGVYLVQGQMLPYGRASLLLREIFGLQVSAGSLAGWVRTCSQALVEVETRIKESLSKAGVINQDETSLWVRRHRSYVHVCSTPSLTHYGYHPSRGRVALNAIGILAGFGGTSIHDGFKIYPGYSCQHALCNAHHLRELTFIEEELKQPWAKKMKDLLLDMKAEVAQAREAGHTQIDVVKLANFHFQYGVLLREGFQLNPKASPPPGGKRVKQSPAWNLLDRLHRYREQALRFLHDFAVAFDNNLAERDLRMSHPSNKRSLEPFGPTKEPKSSAVSAVTFPRCENRAFLSFRRSSRPSLVIRSSRLFDLAGKCPLTMSPICLNVSAFLPDSIEDEVVVSLQLLQRKNGGENILLDQNAEGGHRSSNACLCSPLE